MKKYLKRIFIGICCILSLTVFYFIGYKTAFRAWNKDISISYRSSSSTSSRGLATNKGVREVVQVPSAVYLNPQSLFERAQFSRKDNQLEVLIGNIISVDNKGNKNFVCQVFSKVTLHFEALGIFMKGERVSMDVTGDCVDDEEHQWIGPFIIPFQEILSSSFMNQSFHTSHGEIRFDNVSLQWPKSWILKGVLFESADGQYRVPARIPQTEEEDFFSIEF